MDLNPLVDEIRVSSVLNDDSRSYGEQFLLDGREDTCWNSECSLPQSVNVTFKKQVILTKLRLMFQGGFVGTTCQICVGDQVVCSIFPKDINDLQEFPLPTPLHTSELELKFTMSSDFYGRITIYMIEFVGE